MHAPPAPEHLWVRDPRSSFAMSPRGNSGKAAVETLSGARADEGAPGAQLCGAVPGALLGRAHRIGRPVICRPMMSFWISLAPSKIVKIVASRCQRSTGYSRV